MASGFSVPTKEPWQTPQQYDAILARKQQAYEDRHNELRGNIDNIRTRIAAIDKTANPKEYEETSKALDAANKSYQDFIDPTKNPGVFERVKHLVHAGPGAQAPKDDSGKEIPGAKKLYPSQMKQEAEKLRKALGETQAQVASGPLSPEQQGTQRGQKQAAEELSLFNSKMKLYDQNHPEGVGPNATPEGKQGRQEYANSLLMNGIKEPKEPIETWTDVKGYPSQEFPVGSGNYRTLQVNKKGEKRWKDEPEGYTPQTPQTKPGTSVFSVSLDTYAKSHGYGSFNDIPNEYKEKIKDYEIRKGVLDRTISRKSIVTKIVPDANGVPQQVTVTNYSGPAGTEQLIDPMPPKKSEENPTGGSAHSATASTPTDKGIAKKKDNPTTQQASGGGNVKVGPPLPFQMKTPAIAKAQNEVVEAVGLDSLAKQVEKKPNDAFNQKRLAVTLERQSAGRFTVQALDYVKTLGWGTTLEEWKNKPGTGALPSELVRQLVDGAHENLIAKQDALKAALTPIGGTSQDSSGDADIDAIVKALNGVKK